MKEILLNLFQVFNHTAEQLVKPAAETVTVADWLNSKKNMLFLNPDEIYFSTDWVKLMEDDSETYIDWTEIKFFYYPFVGVNIKLPGFTESKYFSLIIREEKENDPLLNEFIGHLREQAGM